MIIRHVQSDGNCYFRGLSDQMSGSQARHIVLRALIVEFINKNPQKFQNSIDYQYYHSWEDFICKMRENGIFIDGIVIVTSGMFLQRPIIIHQNQERPFLLKYSSLISNDN
ncbi:hypothetical protein I4U23_000072 [Adineta vaga]|nr:hypothetical protein I4U23_000072 [Adineta vaga]